MSSWATRTTQGSSSRLGWPTELVSLGFHLVMLWSVVAAMQRVAPDDRFTILGPLATLGLLLGFALARTPIQDLPAHSVAVWLGAVASVVLVGAHSSDLTEIWSTRAQAHRDLVSGLVESLVGADGGPLSDDHRLVVLGITSWLLAYFSAWVVYRRRWFLAGFGVPAAILLTSLRIDNRNGGLPLALFLVGAIGLAARDSFASNVQRWSSRRMPSAQSLSTVFMAAAVPISLLTVALTLVLNPAMRDLKGTAVQEQLTRSWASMSDFVLDNIQNEAPSNGDYTTFPDEWAMGGELDLGDEIVAEVTSPNAPYLSLRRYDTYTGEGWRTEVGSTFREASDDADQTVTNVTFTSGSSVPLSSDVAEAREPQTVSIRVERPKDDLIFTIDTFASADRSVMAIMGWTHLDGFEIDVNAIDPSDVPVDLKGVIDAVRDQNFSSTESDGSASFADPAVNVAIEEQRERLAAYPVVFSLSVDSEGRLIARFSGRIPNYDDIETVFANTEVDEGFQYSTTGEFSHADSDQLANAGTDYPAWVVQRYLQQSASDATAALTRQIVSDANADDPFHIALAVQDYLRTHITYELNFPPPPDGMDWVDYVLFDHKVGRCEQYATSMVVMVRSLGIPARIVSGYIGGDEQNEAGEWVYREYQSHTWVEVFFPDYGWIPFEPTAAMDAIPYTAGQDDEAQPVSTPLAEVTPEPTPTSETASTPEPDASPIPPSLSTDQPDSGSFGSLMLILLGIGLTLMIGVFGYMLASWRLGLGGLPPASGYFARLLKVGAWFGLMPSQSTTPGEYARAFTRAVPGTEVAVRSITEAYYQERFDPATVDPDSVAAAETGWKQLRRNLLRWRLHAPKSSA